MKFCHKARGFGRNNRRHETERKDWERRGILTNMGMIRCPFACEVNSGISERMLARFLIYLYFGGQCGG